MKKGYYEPIATIEQGAFVSIASSTNIESATMYYVKSKDSKDQLAILAPARFDGEEILCDYSFKVFRMRQLIEVECFSLKKGDVVFMSLDDISCASNLWVFDHFSSSLHEFCFKSLYQDLTVVYIGMTSRVILCM